MHLINIQHLIHKNLSYLVATGKKRFAGMHFNKDATKTPRVDGKVIGQS